MSSRNAWFACVTRPPSSKKKTPMTLASTSRRSCPSLSFSACAVRACSVMSTASPIVPTTLPSLSLSGSMRD